MRSIYGRDPDGNVIELQEILDPTSPADCSEHGRSDPRLVAFENRAGSVRELIRDSDRGVSAFIYVLIRRQTEEEPGSCPITRT